MSDPLAGEAITEIIELHRFLEEWLGQPEGAEDDALFTRVEGALAADFAMVTPQGDRRDCATVLDTLRQARGVHFSEEAPFRIRIEHPAIRTEAGDLILAHYEEWQEARGEVTGRQSTAVFRAVPGRPNGVEWVHLHETWLPGHGPK